MVFQARSGVFNRGGCALAVLVAGLTLMSSLIPGAAQENGAFDPGAFAIGFEEIAAGFDQPVQVVDPGDGSGRLFVVEQPGRVRVIDQGVVLETPFLDITERVTNGFEQGLLSIVFHPAYAENGIFFLYNTDLDGNTRVERWSVSADDPNLADPASAELIFSVEQPYPNHNGGLLLFGPDGYLYIGLGDGGSGGDPEGNGQNTETVLGAILRIDVDGAEEGEAYAIPADNPFVDSGGAAEIWLWGLRNPWRFSFDRATGDLYIGDVGQGWWEEISMFPATGDAPRNFGWNVLEGPDCFEAASCDDAGMAAPIFAYDHNNSGCSVTGGYVYRGETVPQLTGVYLFGDYCTGELWGLGVSAEGEWVASEAVTTGMRISSFGEDANGEVYVIDHAGTIYRVIAGG